MDPLDQHESCRVFQKWVSSFLGKTLSSRYLWHHHYPWPWPYLSRIYSPRPQSKWTRIVHEWQDESNGHCRFVLPSILRGRGSKEARARGTCRDISWQMSHLKSLANWTILGSVWFTKWPMGPCPVFLWIMCMCFKALSLLPSKVPDLPWPHLLPCYKRVTLFSLKFATVTPQHTCGMLDFRTRTRCGLSNVTTGRSLYSSQLIQKPVIPYRFDDRSTYPFSHGIRVVCRYASQRSFTPDVWLLAAIYKEAPSVEQSFREWWPTSIPFARVP